MPKVIEKIKTIYKSYPLILIAVISVILNITIEILGRKTVSGGFQYLVREPLMFLFCTLIIFATLSISLISKRRIFFLSLLSLLWIICGIVNYVLLGYRVVPFSMFDLNIIGSTLTMIHIYMEVWELVLIGAAIILALSGLVYLWIKAPKIPNFGKRTFLKSLLSITVTIGAVALINNSIKADYTIQGGSSVIITAYEKYGFAYCFVNGIVDSGISRPDDYSPEYMEVMKRELDVCIDGTSTPSFKPNIIMVQLESFLDVNEITTMGFSENPVPTFTSLKNNYSSGYLEVPVIGGGTANTEFEVLTGLSADYFGMEFPYMTELSDKTVESICYDLENYGYSTHAIHNNNGTFYNRHRVYPNLGFDRYISMENMENITLTPLGWAEDKILVKEIREALSSTEARDFVYTVTIQTHGLYPGEIIEDAPMDIKIERFETEMSESQKNEFEFYINQLHEVDKFIQELTDYYADFNEPVMIVLFGDHMPNVMIEESDVVTGDLHQMEYVIWSNYDTPVVRKDLKTFTFSAHIFDTLGYNGGYVNTYNRFFSNHADYPLGLRYLGYDMLHSS